MSAPQRASATCCRAGVTMSNNRDRECIRVLVADRSGKTGHVVAQIFNTAYGFECVGVATEPEYFTERMDIKSADVMLLDPGDDGAEWVGPVRSLREEGIISAVVIFSLYGRLMEQPIIRMADAFLRKDCGAEELLTTVRSVAERSQAVEREERDRRGG